MSAPLATLFHGDVTVEVGCDTALYGYGDLSVYRQASIGTGNSTESTNASNGSLIVNGGLGVSAQTNIAGLLTTYSNSNLRTTFFDTTYGGVYVSGGNGIIASVGSAITMTTSVGDIKLNSLTDRVILDSGEAGNDAITLVASNSVGGIDMKSGQNSGLNISTGSLGIVATSAQGPISLTANNGNGSFIVNAASDYKMLTLSMTGDYDTGILIDSASNNTSYKAIQINTSDEDGNIYLTNTSTGNHAGEIQILAGSSGLTATTNTGGSINILARNAPSSFIVNTISANNDLTIGVTGATDSSLVLQSEGTGADALQITTTHPTGSIKITQVAGTGSINVTTGSSGLSVDTQSGGGINLSGNGATSSFINNTSSGNQNLTVCVKGDTASKLILCSEGQNPDAITIQSTGQTGGIYAIAKGPININTSDSSSGINIGTLLGVPINIGTSLSTTTINGSLNVKGTTTTYDSTIVQIKDNILQLNNAPSGVADGGIAIKRYQSANDTCTGDVISDTPEVTGRVSALAVGSISISDPSSPLNPGADYYRGYWVKVTIINAGSPNTTSCFVRRVKSSSTSNGTTGTLTIFTTTDQIIDLKTTPVEGMDITASLGSVDTTFELFPCQWIVSMWDESKKEYALVCSNFVSVDNTNTSIPISHYINLHVNNITANALTVLSINGTTADVQFSITLNDNSTTPVLIDPNTATPPIPIANYPKYGVFIALVRPKTNTANRCYGVFVIGRRNDNSCGQVARIISVKGTNGEMIDMAWPASSHPQLYYRPAPGINASTTDFTIKLITV